MREEEWVRTGSPSLKRRAVDLSLILVSYNSSRVLPEFIRSLRECPPECAWELLAFDNASADDSVSLLRSSFPDAVVLESSQNKGFATAVNGAASHAQGEYLLLANPDIAWAKGAIDRLVRFLRDHPQAAAVTPRLRYPDGRAQPSLRHFPTHGNIWFSRGVPGTGWLSRLFRWYPYTIPDPPVAARIEAAAAACLLVRASSFRDVGGMDEGYFLYVEDTDLCRRLFDAGWEVWIEPESQVVHQWGRSSADYSFLRVHHRRGIRRYFRKFHGHKRVRNGLLFLMLWLADTVTRFIGSERRTGLA